MCVCMKQEFVAKINIFSIAISSFCNNRHTSILNREKRKCISYKYEISLINLLFVNVSQFHSKHKLS